MIKCQEVVNNYVGKTKSNVYCVNSIVQLILVMCVATANQHPVKLNFRRIILKYW